MGQAPHLTHVPQFWHCLSREVDIVAERYRCRIDVTDWNNDGKKDLLVGNVYNGIWRDEISGNVWLFLGK